jgi:hypothetical protein
MWMLPGRYHLLDMQLFPMPKLGILRLDGSAFVARGRSLGLIDAFPQVIVEHREQLVLNDLVDHHTPPAARAAQLDGEERPLVDDRGAPVIPVGWAERTG